MRTGFVSLLGYKNHQFLMVYKKSVSFYCAALSLLYIKKNHPTIYKLDNKIYVMKPY